MRGVSLLFCVAAGTRPEACGEKYLRQMTLQLFAAKHSAGQYACTETYMATSQEQHSSNRNWTSARAKHSFRDYITVKLLQHVINPSLCNRPHIQRNFHNNSLGNFYWWFMERNERLWTALMKNPGWGSYYIFQQTVNPITKCGTFRGL